MFSEKFSNSVHPSLLRRKIIHIDMDAFYASVEMRERPELVGRPVVVGGSPQSRGVVATANYEARKFGIRSAMACAKALKLCPQVVFVRPRFELYSSISRQIRELFYKVTPLVEPMSLDEAYLDVTEHNNGRFAMEIAAELRRQIFETTRLTASAGVAPNKMLAKIASDINKPNGMAIIRPQVVTAFMRSLALSRLPGVGPVTTKRLSDAGLVHCQDLLDGHASLLRDKIGSLYDWLLPLCEGIDEREVVTHYERKSIGTENTFAKDMTDVATMERELRKLTLELCADLRARDITGATVTLKVRYDDFSRITRARTLSEPTNSEDVIYPVLCELLQKTEAGRRRVRLLGLSLSKLGNAVVENW